MLQNQNQTNFSQEKDLKVEDFPIHTMKKDLEEASNTTRNIELDPKSAPMPSAMQKKEISAKIQGSSPFLQKISYSEKEHPRLLQQISNVPIQSKPGITNTIVLPIKEPISVIQFPQQDSNRSGKLINVFLAISLLLAVFGGSYYAWYTGTFSGFSPNLSLTDILSKLGIDRSPTPPSVVPISLEIKKYSSDKPNYLNIDTKNADKLKIKESIKKYADEINTLGITAPIEFIIVDSQNNPVSFKDFATKTEIILSSSIITQLESNFSLFIYNDNNLPKLGLMIPAQNSAKLKESLLPAEKTLIKSLNPLFLFQEITFDNNPFSSSSYGESSIRYKNLSPELSIDYSITNDKLAIGTSKMTLRAIIDYQKKK